MKARRIGRAVGAARHALSRGLRLLSRRPSDALPREPRPRRGHVGRLRGEGAVVASAVAAVSLAWTHPAAAIEQPDLPRLGRGVNVLGYDPIWSNPTQARFKPAYFAEIRRAGFSQVRLNLQAFAHMAADATLDPDWFKTLDGLVAEALRAGLTVILDEHDSGPCSHGVAECRRRLMAFWRQVAPHFRDAPPQVMFEVLNEPSGELTPDLWNGLLTDCLAEIRKTNPTRGVVIGPGTYNDLKDLPKLVLPPGDRRIIVTFHYYAPFPFTHQGATWTTPSRATMTGVTWSAAGADAVGRDFRTVATWARAEKRPVMLGEFGAFEKGAMPSRVAWTSTVARKAEAAGFSWCYWQFDKDFIVFDVDHDRWVPPILHALVPPSR